MGYVPELGDGKVLHAWNEIWLDNKWVSVDTTFDSAAAAAGKTYTMARDRSKATIIKVY
jgi:transglutaminase-like putative cysteine protease